MGGATFDFGMVLSSGSKTLVRIGGRSLKSLVVFAIMGIAGFATLKSMTAVARVERVATIDRVAVDFTFDATLPNWLVGAWGLAPSVAVRGLALLIGSGLIIWALCG